MKILYLLVIACLIAGFFSCNQATTPTDNKPEYYYSLKYSGNCGDISVKLNGSTVGRMKSDESRIFTAVPGYNYVIITYVNSGLTDNDTFFLNADKKFYSKYIACSAK